jgi:hypothetical protein
MKRVRTVVTAGDYGCGVLEESRACNTFTCAAVVTVTGGLNSAGLPRGYGPKGPSGNSDLEYAPVSVTAMTSAGVDVVFTAGQEHPTISPPIYRVDIAQDAISLMISGQYMGARSVALSSVAGPASELFATTNLNNVGKIDLTLMMKCEDWMTHGLNHWDSDPKNTGQLARSNQLRARLKIGGISESEWEFVAYRKSKRVSFPDFKTLEDPEPWKGNLVKNVLCMRETQKPEENRYTTEECCVSKYGPTLVKPCDGIYPECSGLHAKVLDQWASAKRDLEDEMNML